LRPLSIYLSGVSLSSIAMGIQVVLLPWLAVGVLGLDSEQLGWVQASVLLPSLLLVLQGGAVADRTDGGRRMPQLLLALALVHLLMSLLVSKQWLVLPLLLVYGVALGACQAFMQPLRDSMLPRVVKPGDAEDLQRTVVKISLCYFVFQGLGILLAGQLDWFGVSGLLLAQVLVLVLAAGRYRRLPTVVNPGASDSIASEFSLGQGVVTVFKSPVLRLMIALVAFNGFMQMGVFIVALPLLVRDIYFADATFFAGLQLAFVVGSVAANIGLLKRESVKHPGRSVLFCLFYAGVILLAIGAKPTPVGLFLLVFCWGCVTGVSASLSKAVVQQLAPAELRGRVMSVYQLALFGMAPLGALACGYAIEYWGILTVLLSSGVLAAILFFVSTFVPSLWQLRQDSLQ
jgi:MFS family permease